MLIDALEKVECKCGFEGKLVNCSVQVTDKVSYNCPRCGSLLKIFFIKRVRQPKHLFETSLGILSIREAVELSGNKISEGAVYNQVFHNKKDIEEVLNL